MSNEPRELPVEMTTTSPIEDPAAQTIRALQAKIAKLEDQIKGLGRWQCTQCGCRFEDTKTPDFMLEGVTHCSSCAHLEALQGHCSSQQLRIEGIRKEHQTKDRMWGAFCARLQLVLGETKRDFPWLERRITSDEDKYRLGMFKERIEFGYAAVTEEGPSNAERFCERLAAAELKAELAKERADKADEEADNLSVMVGALKAEIEQLKRGTPS